MGIMKTEMVKYDSSFVTFDWTNVRVAELVGFDGEDRRIPGVVNEGNLVHVHKSLIQREDQDGFADIEGGRWELTEHAQALIAQLEVAPMLSLQDVTGAGPMHAPLEGEMAEMGINKREAVFRLLPAAFVMNLPILETTFQARSLVKGAIWVDLSGGWVVFADTLQDSKLMKKLNS